MQCARDEARLVIYVGRSASKKWWRNFIDGHAVLVRIGGASHDRNRYSKITVSPADPLVVIDLAGRVG